MQKPTVELFHRFTDEQIDNHAGPHYAGAVFVLMRNWLGVKRPEEEQTKGTHL
jgi:hypothetical protein